MATESNIEKDDDVFIGEDKQLSFTVLDSANVPIDITGWALAFIMRRKDTSTGDPVLSKATGSGISITGTYDADPAVNTQRAVVALADTDTAQNDGTIVISPAKYRYSLKRTDAGSETILAFGNFVLREATARA
jgi:hypothetical protein